MLGKLTEIESARGYTSQIPNSAYLSLGRTPREAVRSDFELNFSEN